MSGGAERPIFSKTQDWVDAVSEHSNEYSEQRANLLREGFKLFFDTVLELPDLDKQPSKHWSDYQEQDINFVTHDLDSEQALDEEMLRLRMSETLGFWSPPPIRIGVFDVRDYKREARKGIHKYSAGTVIESIYGEIFRPRVVLQLHYRYSDASPDWYEEGIRYDLFGISGEQLKKIQSADEMDLLLAANAAAALYAKEIRQMDLQTAT